MEVGKQSRLRLLQSLRGSQDASAEMQQARLIEHHSLLSDPSTATGDQEECAQYFKHLLGSLAGKMEDRLIAVQLLGTATQESSSHLFLQHFEEWAQQLLVLIKSDKRQNRDADCFRAGLFSALRDIFFRVGELIEMAEVRRVASPLASALGSINLKQVQPGTDDRPEVLARLTALACALTALPAAFRANARDLEAMLLKQHLTAEHETVPRRLAAAQCLALLAQASGDMGAWSMQIQRLLVTAHQALDAAFLGLEDTALVSSAKAAVQPHVPSLAADKSWQPGAGGAKGAAGLLAVLGGLLETLESMLTASQQTAVPFPAASFFMLLSRILAFDDSLLTPGTVPVSTAAYLEVIGMLPALHVAALKLLGTWLAVGRAALTPLFGAVSRLLADLLQRQLGTDGALQASWQTRVQVCMACSELVRIAGPGAARMLVQPALRCAVLELTSTQSAATGLAPHKPKAARKRKKSQVSNGDIVDAADSQLGRGLLSGAAFKHSLQAQAACLQLLETLLRIGGAIFTMEQRAQLDAVAAHAASTSAAAAQKLLSDAAPAERERLLRRVQLAAYQALLASVLAPFGSRPTFLPLALRLFGQALVGSTPNLAAFAASALPSCEALLHPRANPPLSRVAPELQKHAVAAATKLRHVAPTEQQPPEVHEPTDPQQPVVLPTEPVQQRPSIAKASDQVGPSASPEPAGRASADNSAGTSVLGSRATTLHPGQSSAGEGMPRSMPQQNGGQAHDRLLGSDAAESSLTQAEIEAQEEADLQAGLLASAAEARRATDQMNDGDLAGVPKRLKGIEIREPVKEEPSGVDTSRRPQADKPAARGSWQTSVKPLLGNDLSSDSEGPLPDIDSGTSSEEE